MLGRYWHRQFATKLFPALQEKRLLRFANDDDDTAFEQTPEEEGPNEVHELASQPDITKRISGDVRKQIESTRPLVASNIAASQFLYSEAVDLLKDGSYKSIDGVQEFLSEGRSYLTTFDATQDPTLSESELTIAREQLAERSEKMEQLIERILKHPRVALAMTQAFERRTERYDELKRTLGDTSPQALTALEVKLKLDNPAKLDLNDNGDTWDENEVDSTLEELHIDTTAELQETRKEEAGGKSREIRAAIRGVIDNAILAPEDVDASGKPTKHFKLKLLRRKLTAARQLAIMEKVDLGSETTLDNTTSIEVPLAKQLLNARKHLESTLMLQAEEYMAQWDALREQLGLPLQYTSQDVQQVANQLNISELALFHRIQEVQDTLNRALRRATHKDGTSAEDNLPEASSPTFKAESTRVAVELNELSWLQSNDEARRLNGFMGDLVQQKKGAEAWATQNATALRTTAERLSRNPELLANVSELLQTGEVIPERSQGFIDVLEHCGNIATRIESGIATDEDLDYLHDNLPTHKRHAFDMIMLALTSPAFMRQARRDKKLIDNDNTKNTADVRRTIISQVEEVEQKLLNHPTLEHLVCSALPIKEEISKTVTRIVSQMRHATHVKGELGDQLVREARLDTSKLTKTLKELDRLEHEGEHSRVRSVSADNLQLYIQKAGTDTTVACFNRRDGIIYVNEQAIANRAKETGRAIDDVRQEAIYHERGHAIVSILMYEVGALPRLMLSMHQVLKQPIPDDANGRTFEDLLASRAEDWGITDTVREKVLKYERQKPGISEQQAQENTDDYLKEMLMDELANKYASWKHQGNDEGFSKEDLALLKLIDTPEGAPPNISFDIEGLTDRPEPDVALQSSQTESGDVFGGTDDGHEPQAVTAPMISQDIVEAQNQFLLINEFIKNHQKTPGVDDFEGWVREWEDYFNSDIKKEFYNSAPGDDRVSEAVLVERLRAVQNKCLKGAKDQMESITAQEMEQEDNGSNLGLFSMFKGMELASINNVIGMCQSIGEDLQRMWKRKNERVQSTLGQDITGWIPDNNIWGLRYAGQLKHEFGRRSNASEIEEVKQWKDALGDSDSYSLQALLGESKNKDQIRAIVELLIERGRLDFNNEELWGRLSYLSGMKMPVEACKNNSVLRDKWLQKMVTAIWDDKDKFFDWRQSNDSGIDSGKKKFSQVADQLSNLRGGLSGALFRQLKLWTEAKASGADIPDDVNPHLYEEILHYAMKNGKMSMEEKLFYLVQGARHGLISIDRVQALAGDHGGVLNIFPFIDYFYGKNNTFPEIYALGNRLEESASGDARFKPGPKTTLWLHMELLRNESARQRISKATSGTRAENIDHEDIPTIVAQADYKTIERLTDIVSGSREKLSPEAAKNTYTGFGTKFKILARLAELDERGEARFTEADALEAGKAIASYIHMDNIFTRNGSEKPQRNEISWSEFETQAPSSAGLSVKTFRTANNDFVQTLLQRLGNEINWNKTGTTVEKYLRTSSDVDGKTDDYQKANFKATGVFAREIANALTKEGNRKILKEVLRSYANKFKEENYDNAITQEMMKGYLAARQQHQ